MKRSFRAVAFLGIVFFQSSNIHSTCDILPRERKRDDDATGFLSYSSLACPFPTLICIFTRRSRNMLGRVGGGGGRPTWFQLTPILVSWGNTATTAETKLHELRKLPRNPAGRVQFSRQSPRRHETNAKPVRVMPP